MNGEEIEKGDGEIEEVFEALVKGGSDFRVGYGVHVHAKTHKCFVRKPTLGPFSW